MSSANKESSTQQSTEAVPELSPLEGGRWRPVRPEELLRKSVPPPVQLDVPEVQKEPKPKLRLAEN